MGTKNHCQSSNLVSAFFWFFSVRLPPMIRIRCVRTCHASLVCRCRPCLGVSWQFHSRRWVSCSVVDHSGRRLHLQCGPIRCECRRRPRAVADRRRYGSLEIAEPDRRLFWFGRGTQCGAIGRPSQPTRLAVSRRTSLAIIRPAVTTMAAIWHCETTRRSARGRSSTSPARLV